MRIIIARLLKVNIRVIVFTLMLLIGFDLFLQYYLLPLYLNPDYQKTVVSYKAPAVRRLPADDPGTLALWKQQLVGARGYKIVFLGDSVVHGGGVPREEQTIPAYLARELKILLPHRDIQVFNFSLPGCTPADTYHIFNYIRDANPDLVIYDANIGWFGSAKIMEHPRLQELGQKASVPAADHDKNAQTMTGPSDWEEALSQFASDHWVLYRHRIFLNYVWFGGPLKEKLKIGEKEESQPETKLTEEKEKYKPWYQKNFDVLRKTRGKLGYVSLTPYNQHWVMYNRLMSLMGQEKSTCVVFIVPRNTTLYKKYDLWDEPVLREKQAQLTGAARKKGIAVFDYTFSVPDHYFTDSVHLTADGNRILAERLAADMVRSGIIK